jgi:hypothetical protein
LTPFYNSKTQKHIEVKQRTKKTFSCTCYLSQLFDEIDVMSGIAVSSYTRSNRNAYAAQALMLP